MAESDSAWDATAGESSNLMSKARDILATPSHELAEIMVDQLFMGQETEEFRTALTLYDFCAAHFPNCLTLKLLNVYQSSSNGVTRFRSINLLAQTLTDLRNINFELNLVALHEIKPVLLTCLTMEDTKEAEIQILRRIVSKIAYDVMKLDNGGWDELSDVILSFADNQPIKAFHVFLDLPPVNGRFIDRFLKILLGKIHEVLTNPEEEDWSLAIQAYAKLGIQVLDSEMESEVIKNKQGTVKIFGTNVCNSAKKLLKKGMEQSVIQGLEDLEKFLSRDEKLYRYNKDQCLFVCLFAKNFIALSRTHMVETVRKIINRFIGKPSIDHDWFKYLDSLPPLEIFRIFTSKDVEERTREMAIRRLSHLLSQHTLKKAKIDVSVFIKLQPLLMFCLWEEEGISDDMFKILGQVIYDVAFEMFIFQDQGDKWNALREYLEWNSETDFEKVVYIFQCLAMPLDDEAFLLPVMDSLLPEITKRLSPPKEFSISIDNNSSWVLAFTGGFCAATHLVQVYSVEEIAYKMVGSVEELVGRGMEVGFVRRGFRDLESIVKKYVEWYGKEEYKFVKGFLWRLYAIKGMKMESKIVLWRINVILEREVKGDDKELPKDDLDWVNGNDDDEEEEDDIDET